LKPSSLVVRLSDKYGPHSFVYALIILAAIISFIISVNSGTDADLTDKLCDLPIENPSKGCIAQPDSRVNVDALKFNEKVVQTEIKTDNNETPLSNFEVPSDAKTDEEKANEDVADSLEEGSSSPKTKFSLVPLVSSEDAAKYLKEYEKKPFKMEQFGEDMIIAIEKEDGIEFRRINQEFRSLTKQDLHNVFPSMQQELADDESLGEWGSSKKHLIEGAFQTHLDSENYNIKSVLCRENRCIVHSIFELNTNSNSFLERLNKGEFFDCNVDYVVASGNLFLTVDFK
jgi:hypothetical protein